MLQIIPIIFSFWLIIPIFNICFLFVKSTTVLVFLQKILPEKTNIFVNKYVKFFYGIRINYILNVIHTCVFTLWGFILRIAIINNWGIISLYYPIFVFYFINVSFRILDNIICFIFIEQNKIHFMETPDDSSIEEYPVPPPTTRPKTHIVNGPQWQPPQLKNLVSRIYTQRVLKAGCYALGVCFAGWASWEAHRANNLQEAANNYNFFKGERDQLNYDYDHKIIDRQTYDEKLADLKMRTKQD